jgi:hypothetical protein
MLVDFHHSSLMRSLVMLFEERLGIDVYRPIGMEWYHEGYWTLNDQEDTARQYLEYGSQPIDNTPPLNTLVSQPTAGVFSVFDAGRCSAHKAITYDAFMAERFDYVLFSQPRASMMYSLLARLKDATLLQQVGNNEMSWSGVPTLASLKPRGDDPRVCYYHQEFNTGLFYPSSPPRHVSPPKISTFVNVLHENPQGWQDYNDLKSLLAAVAKVQSFGGQCENGSCDGPWDVARTMRNASMVLHSKGGGDGYGHVIYSAFCAGKPMILRPSQYKDMLAEELIQALDGHFVNLDEGVALAADKIRHLLRPENYPELAEMGAKSRQAFEQCVSFEEDAVRVQSWLDGVRDV